MLDKRVDCMNCLCANNYGFSMVPGVVVVSGVTHALAQTGSWKLYCMCDFDKTGTLRLYPMPQPISQEGVYMPPLASSESLESGEE